MKNLFILSVVFVPFSLHAQWIELTMPTTANVVSSSFVSDDEGWVGTDGGALIHHTTDGGMTWETDTIPSASGPKTWLDFPSATIGYCINNKKVYKSVDGGQSWSQLNYPGIGPVNEPYFLNEDTGFISEIDSVFKTTDGGVTWKAVPLQYVYDEKEITKFSFQDNQHGIGVDGINSLYVTEDGGESWLNWGYTHDNYFGACHSKLGTEYTCGFETDGITYEYQSADIWSEHGWSEYCYYCGQHCFPLDISSFDNGRVYAVGRCGRVIYTENDGFHWKDTTLTTETLNIVDGIHDIYVFGNTGIAFKRFTYCAVAALFNFDADAQVVQFNDWSLDAISWFWDFGDGSTSTLQHPVHTFAVAGKHEICLAISGSCGSDTLCDEIIICEPNTSASPYGMLDNTFDDDGIMIDDISGVDYYYDYVSSLLVQPDGKIVICNNDSYSLLLARYNGDGSRDSSFNGDGVIDGGINYQPKKIALSPQGKLAVGFRSDGAEVIQYDSFGNVDSSFGTNGSVFLDSPYGWPMSLAYQPDGKLLLFDIDDDVPNVARYNPDGSLDLSFASDGVFNADSDYGDGSDDLPADMLIQPDGKIVIGLTSDDPNYWMMRLNPDGTVDTSFGANGQVSASFLKAADTESFLRRILLRPDGKYIVAGQGSVDNSYNNIFYGEALYCVSRFKSDGSIDSTFAYAGTDSIKISSQDSYGVDAVVQSDGKILMTGFYGFPWSSSNPGEHYKIGLIRWNEDGGLDSTFGNNGLITTTIDCGDTRAYSIALHADKIYVGGSDPGYDFLIARYNNSCFPVASFSFSGNELTVEFTDQSAGGSSWSWDFGDGNTSTLQNPSHTYTTEGSYNVCLTVTDSCGSDFSCLSITLCNPLNTDFLYQENGLSLQMQNQFTEATSFFWDFGDGTTSTQQNPVHDFPSSDTYHVCLVEWDECDSDTICKDIAVCGTVISDFSYLQNGNAVSFTNNSSNDLFSSWDFGDGNFSLAENPSHTYTQAGTFDVCLTVGDSCATDISCQSITTTASCNADFTLFGDTSLPGLYYGYNLASGDNLTYTWSWGDGSSSTGELPSHQYADSGLYTICQMILDTVSFCADTFCLDYNIMKGQIIYEIIFVDYPVTNEPVSIQHSAISIYPNPFTDQITVQFELNQPGEVYFYLTDLTGKILRSFSAENKSEGLHKQELNLEEIVSGVYFLQFHLSNQTHYIKMIRQ